MPEEEYQKPNKFSKILNVSLIVIFIATILVNFYFLFFQKSYDFIVETSCDPTKEECFERDCTNPDDCPPNGLSLFKRYSLSARDFKMCENEDCTYACESGVIECTQLECVEDLEWGEFCVSPENALELEPEADTETVKDEE